MKNLVIVVLVNLSLSVRATDISKAIPGKCYFTIPSFKLKLPYNSLIMRMVFVKKYWLWPVGFSVTYHQSQPMVRSCTSRPVNLLNYDCYTL